MPFNRTPAATRTSRTIRRPRAGQARPTLGLGQRVIGTRGLAIVTNYVREVRSEVKKVVWPTRKEITNLTLVVLGLSGVVGLFLGGVDFVYQEFFRWFIAVFGGSG